jgi:uncharacterized protein YhaN
MRQSMRITELDIAGFGKLLNKKLQLENGLNVIYGDNEAGKTSLHTFIMGMFFGLKRKAVLKDGTPTDLKKFEPWYSDIYGGKLTYIRKDNKKFIIERNFKKRNCIIYDEKLEDITKQFKSTKTKGVDVLNTHFDISEELFQRVSVINQKEGRIQKENKDELISQILNIFKTGYEDISVKNAQALLKKAVNENIGTGRTDKRPLNILDDKLNSIKKELSQQTIAKENDSEYARLVEEKSKTADSISKKISDLKQKIPFIEERDSFLKQNREYEIANKSFQSITAIKKRTGLCQEEINDLRENITESDKNGKLQKVKKSGRQLTIITILMAAVLISMVCLYIFSGFSPIGMILSSVFTAASLIIKIYNNKRIKKYKHNEKELKKIKEKIQLQEENIDRYNKEIEEKLSDVSAFINIKIESQEDLEAFISNTLKGIERYKQTRSKEESIKSIPDKENLREQIAKLEKERVETLIELEGYKTELKNHRKQESEIQKLVEEKAELEKKKVGLMDLKEKLELSMKLLEESADEMKNDFTPGLISQMEKLVIRLTDNKYKSLRTDTNLMLKAIEEKDSGIRDVLSLSSGTVDQMYLILRMSLAGYISKNREEMPFIFDEPFMQFDDKRIMNTLYILKENYNDRQIILFTCKSREIELIQKVFKEDSKVINL